MSDRAQEARERAEQAIADIGLFVALWHPHGLDTGRIADGQTASAIREALATLTSALDALADALAAETERANTAERQRDEKDDRNRWRWPHEREARLAAEARVAVLEELFGEALAAASSGTEAANE